MNTIQLLSHANDKKPQTIVDGDCAGLRMRGDDELVHLRDDEDKRICVKCGHVATVWLGSADRWASHKARCR
jgi:hypothetical protein